MKFGAALVLAVVGLSQPGTQPTNCAPRERRSAAVRHARAINTAEANRPKPYQPLAQLSIPVLPDDYKVQLTTDGTSYSFSIKDTTDACHGVVFSDQEGVIYSGGPLQ